MPAISNVNTIPTIVSARMIRHLFVEAVYARLTNRNWEGEIRRAGDRVRINMGEDITVQEYTGTVAYQDAMAGTPVELVIDKQKYWAVKYDDVDAAMSVPNMLDESVRRGARALAVVVDTDVRAAMVADATDITDDLVVNFNALRNSAGTAAGQAAAGLAASKAFPVASWHRRLDEAKAPRAGRWIIVGPYYAQALAEQGILNPNGTLRDVPVTGGQVGSYQGFDIFVSDIGNTAAATSGNPAMLSKSEELFIGTNYSTAFAGQIRRTERIRLETAFADAVRGLFVYGTKVVEPSTLFRQTATLSNLS